jgi:hypothetical protein
MVRRLAAILLTLAVGLAACSSPETDNTAAPSQQGDTPLAERTYPPATAQVVDAVKAARDIQKLPAAAEAQLPDTLRAAGEHSKEFAMARGGKFDCHPRPSVPGNWLGECAFGDPNGTKLMVLFGDSHALMWSAALEGIAAKRGWKLRVFSLGGCPPLDLHFADPKTGAPYKDCDDFVEAAGQAIKDLKPDLLIATSFGAQLADGSWPSEEQWRDGWISMFHKLTEPGTGMAILGVLPSWPHNDARCLAAHVNDVQKCSAAAGNAITEHPEDESAAAALGAVYVSADPWICSDKCEPVIADKIVYEDPEHLAQTYTVYLTDALEEALQPVLGKA